MKYDNGVIGMRDEIYKAVNKGHYSSAAMWCELMSATQKIIFGKDFFDADLEELTTKLYIEAGKAEEAWKKIQFM